MGSEDEDDDGLELSIGTCTVALLATCGGVGVASDTVAGCEVDFVVSRRPVGFSEWM